jgi:L-asparaginase II
MLRSRVRNGWPSEGYRLAGIRSRRRCLAVHAEAPGWDEGEIPTGVDGCGVLTFALPLERMAHAFSTLRAAGGGGRVAAACANTPS